jgi:membrane protease subunit HflK
MQEGGFERRRLDPEEELMIMREAFRRTTRRVTRLVPLVVVLAIAGWFLTGFYQVQPGEVGVVRTFGAFTHTTPPGLQYRLPSPMQEVDVVNVQAIRRIEVGFRTDRGQSTRVANEALMLTGDENIVDAQIIVQYRVREPDKFLFQLRNPEDAVRASTEVALRGVVGNMRIDEILTTERGAAQQRTWEELQRLLDLYQSGILVTNVQLQTVDVPDQVRDAFNEVVRAFQDRDRLRNEAEAYVADIIPKARGQAQQTIRAAEAYREQRMIQAQGDAARFEALLAEYTKAKDVTRERLRLETLERVLSETDKVVVDGSVGQSVLPFLPLRDMANGRAQTPQAAPQPTPQAQPQQPAQPQQQQPQPKPQTQPQAKPTAQPSR